MQTNSINNSLQNIFKGLSKYTKDKETQVWEIGTDFFVYLKRWNYISKYINENHSDILNSNSEIKIDWRFISPENGVLDLYSTINSDEKIIRTEILTSQVFGTSKNEKNIIVNMSDKPMGTSTIRQFIEAGISFGYISPDDKFKKGSTFTLQRISDTFKGDNDKEMLDFLFKIVENSWDLKKLKGVSIRDIALTIVLTYYVFNKNDIEWMRPILGDNTLEFRTKKSNERIRDFNLLSATYYENNASLKKQTTINKHYNDGLFEEEYFKLLSFIEDKILLGWKVDESTIVNKALEFENAISKRNKQPIYRQQMLNSMKRYQYIKGVFNRHDILMDITNSNLVQAAHILDHRYCEEKEKYDPENGILLDPTIHNYFDRDIIAIDEEGNIFALKNFLNEIIRLLPWANGESKINKNILTNKTIKYIKKRNYIHSINFDEYKRI